MLSTSIIDILNRLKQSVNKSFQVNAYWHIGRLLDQAIKQQEWSAQQIKAYLSDQAKAISETSTYRIISHQLTQMRSFYQAYPDWSLVQVELSWSHYQKLSKIAPLEKRLFYTREAAANHWNTKELLRQIKSKQFERSNSSDAKASLDPSSILKEKYVLEFTQLPDSPAYKEKDLEDALIQQLQNFLTELGKGFSFVARQKRIATESGKQFFIDLVFYHFILKCFVLIDLKITELSHRDIGQMDMYVRLYEDKWRRPEDHPTIGVILCPKLDPTIIEYSMIKNNPQLFASTYQLVHPEKGDLSDHFFVALFHESLLNSF